MKNPEPEYKDWVFEISAPEGGEFTDFKVTGVYGGGIDFRPIQKPPKYILHMYMKVVGFRDDIATMRNWGVGPFMNNKIEAIEDLINSLEDKLNGKTKR